MGQHLHVLSQIDLKRETATCRACGVVRIVNLHRHPICERKRQEDNRRNHRDPRYKASREAAHRRYRATPKGRARAIAAVMRYHRTPKGRAKKAAHNALYNAHRKVRRRAQLEALRLIGQFIESLK